jgi:Fic family protein
VEIEPELASLLSKADQAIGRLDGAIRNMPNPDLFVAMYVRSEAVLSSQIEGTQSTLEDLLAVELEPRLGDTRDVDEIVNYVRAMKFGLQRLESLPLSLRLIREIHAELLTGVRGANKQPGEFRRDQNFIAPAGIRDIRQATFVPPAVPDMISALDNFEKFLHAPSELPVLLTVGLAHAQFETIHPFLDGNGRVGRLLITFQLVHSEVLHRPVLYLSLYLKRNRLEYYDQLMAVRHTGDWESWLRFFVRGVAETAEEASTKAQAIVALQEALRKQIQADGLSTNALRLLDHLFDRPLTHVNLAKKQLGVSFVTANKLMDQFETAGIIREVTGRKRDRIFRFEPYLALFDESAPSGVEGDLQETAS